MSNGNANIDNTLDLLKGGGVAAASDLASGTDAPVGASPRTPSDKVVRIGVVGGNFGATFQWHLDPNCKVTAVCDLRDDRLERLVELMGRQPSTRISANSSNIRNWTLSRSLHRCRCTSGWQRKR